MQNQKQHFIISICSLIVGNQISDRHGYQADKAKETAEQAEEAAGGVESSTQPVSGEPTATDTTADAKRAANAWRPVISKALGTLLLALLVWVCFGRKREADPEQ